MSTPSTGNYAYVMAQVALLNTKRAAMEAANFKRARLKLPPTYDEEAFNALFNEYAAKFGVDALVKITDQPLERILNRRASDRVVQQSV